MRKSRGKPVPVKWSSSQSPSSRCISPSRAAARAAVSDRASPAATRAGEALEGMPGDVEAGRVDDSPEVKERYVVEPVGVVVDVEAAPAAVARLHGGEPAAGPLDGRPPESHLLQGEPDHRGVVYIRV